MKLKTKILAGISFLLLSALSLNLFYSFRIISADKKAYIFENALNQVEKLSNDVVTRIRQLYSSTSTYWYLSQNSPQQLNSILDSQDFILGIQFVTPQLTQNFFKSDNLALSNLSPQEIQNIFQKKIEIKSGLSLFKTNDYEFLLFVVSSNGIDITYILDAGLWGNLFTRFGIFDSLLLIDNVPIIGFHPGEEFLQTLLERKEVKASFETNVRENELLVSFARYQDLGLTLVSYAAIKDANSFLNQLVYRSLFFGLMILGLSLIFGLFFSYQVTSPIVTLTQMARAVANGDYTKKATIKTKDEIRVLGDTFNQMSSDIASLLQEKEVMIHKLEDYNLNLEKKVEERTKQLKDANTFIEAMINSLDQGLFVIDKDLNCLPTYTQACVKLFDKQPENLKFQDLLQLNTSEVSTIQKWADILFSEKIPFDSAKNLGPKEKVFRSNEDFKHVAIDYYPMRTDDHSVGHVVVVATDKTNEVKAIQQFEEKTAYVEMVLKLIRLKTDFFKFINQAEKMLEQLADLLSLAPIDLDKCLFLYHSLNGGFGSFSIRDLQQKARSCEQLIVDLRTSEKSVESVYPLLREDFKHFCTMFSEKKSELSNIFGEKSNHLEIDKDGLLKFKAFVKQLNIPSLTSAYIDTFSHRPLEDYFIAYEELISQLAEKLNKPMNPLKILSENIRIPSEIYEEFFAVMIHLFRNTMDHGIETYDVRSRLEKPPKGSITIKTCNEIKNNQTFLKLEFSDDGAGIDPQVIRNVWINKNPDRSIDELNDQDVINLIFDPNFSTSSQLTELSGRGVGMSSVKDVVSNLGGDIFIDSKINIGTKFIIYLPYIIERDLNG